METAARRILASLAWIGMILAGHAMAQEMNPPTPIPQGQPRSMSSAPAREAAASPTEGGWIVGEEEPDLDAVFGNRILAGCEMCGGGDCLPPRWSVDNDIRIMKRGQNNKSRLISEQSDSTGPFLVSSSPVEYRYFNDTTVGPLMYTDAEEFQLSPSWQIMLHRYLGRDGDGRDHFFEFGFWGFSQWNVSHTVTGSPTPLNPYFDPDTTSGTTVDFTPITLSYEGDLRSPFRITAPVGPTGIPATQDAFLSDAFNRAEIQSYNYSSNFDSYEFNMHVKGGGREDQLVMNPNGRWYRQCRSGVYYSYLFGLRGYIVDEKFEFMSRGGYYAPSDPNGTTPLYTKHGRYVVRTDNWFLGLQFGGSLEYRACQWTFDLHSKGGPGVNIARQKSHVQASLLDPDGDNLTTPLDNRWHASRNVAAVFGEIGGKASYRFNPHWVGHVSYDMMWIGSLALAPDQMIFQSAPTQEIHTTGSTFLQGLSFGLDFGW